MQRCLNRECAVWHVGTHQPTLCMHSYTAQTSQLTLNIFCYSVMAVQAGGLKPVKEPTGRSRADCAMPWPGSMHHPQGAVPVTFSLRAFSSQQQLLAICDACNEGFVAKHWKYFSLVRYFQMLCSRPHVVGAAPGLGGADRGRCASTGGTG